MIGLECLKTVDIKTLKVGELGKKLQESKSAQAAEEGEMPLAARLAAVRKLEEMRERK